MVRMQMTARSKESSGRQRPLKISEKLITSLLVVNAFLAIIAFGAMDVAVAMMLAATNAISLCSILVAFKWARRDFARLEGLRVQLVLFCIVLAAVIWPLTPWGVGGPHSVWKSVPDAAGSIAIDRSALIANVLQLAALGFVFVTARIVGASRSRAIWMLWSIVIAMGVYAAFALLSHIATGPGLRLSGTLLSPNSAATIFGSGVVVAVGVGLARIHKMRIKSVSQLVDPITFGVFGVAALLAVVLLLTGSRMGGLVTLLSLVMFLGWQALVEKYDPKAVLIAAIALLVIIIMLGFSRGGVITAGRFEVFDNDLETRSVIFSEHWRAFLERPWFGYGLGSFPTVNNLIIIDSNHRYLFSLRATHNLYLQWLEETGVVGALAMLVCVTALLVPLVRGGFRPGVTGAWARASCGAALVFLLHGLTDFALQVPAIQALVALFLGVLISVVSPSSTSSKQAGKLVPWLGAASCVVAVSSFLVAVPIFASRMGGDLTAWPTAHGEALAFQIERDLWEGTPASLTQAGVLSVRELHMRPASGGAWLRRAAVDAASGHYVEAGQALERSFIVAPFQTSLFRARLKFAYENWGVIGDASRKAMADQLELEWRRSRSERPFLRLANEVKNPTGRLGLALAISAFRTTDPRPDTPRR